MAESTYCLSFDGSSGVVDCGTVSTATFSTVSISCWIKIASGGKASVGWADTANHRCFLLLFGNALYFVTENGNLQFASLAFTGDSAWHHFLLVFNSGTVSGYLDGSPCTFTGGTGSSTQPTYAVTGNLRFGHDPADGIWTDGAIADVAAWNADLSSHAAALAAAVNFPQDYPSGLLGLSHFSEGSGNTTADSSGNGNTGALTGGVTWSTQVPDTLRPPGLLWRVESNLEGYSNGATVATWHDQSGNGYDATGHATPVFATNQVNSLPAVNFGGAAYFTLAADGFTLTDFTMMVVINSTGDTIVAGSVGGSSLQLRYGEASGGGGSNHISTYSDNATHGISSSLAVAQGNWCILEWVCSGGTVTYYQNGVSYGTGSMPGVSPLTEFSGVANGTAAIGGYVAEAILWNKSLNSTDRLTWETTLAAKYKLSPIFDSAANGGYQVATASPTGFSLTTHSTSYFVRCEIELLSVPGTTVTTATYNGVALTFIGAQSSVSGANRVEFWGGTYSGLGNLAAGTYTVAYTLSAAITSIGTACSYTAVDQATPTEAFNSAQATNVGAADATVNITPVVNNTLVVGAVSTTATSITANQTSRNNVSGTAGSGADSDAGDVATAAATTVSFTGVGALATWAIGGYAIRPFASSITIFTGWNPVFPDRIGEKLVMVPI